MSRREFPRKVRAEIVLRAVNGDGRIACEGCGLVLGHKPYHVDHTIPEGLLADKSRPLTAADGRLLGWDCCHKPKTAVDVGQIAKSTRQRDKALGIRKAPAFQSKWKRKVNGQTVLREGSDEIH